ncbi:uncharacterized protein GGS25DRAFT_93440 [Hypoxylon fragiforme]|uniref:uncharacterized protein n=1 Tax=Hypoxylon fragiforme TaxID=63214 RepID=UPI0020C6F54C|nr:uncharacterized protein GGS25DRAFT_93440 [Hypoxylon fragiforme]KAI2603447.1 hypothetical protein GGS25DRAFT_93440 [Hypoxylon fragiforme]
MRFASIIAAVLSTAITSVHGNPQEPQGSGGLPAGYKLADTTWSGNITANGPKLTFTGFSMQDIEYQIRKANPSFPLGGKSALAVRAGPKLDCQPADFWWAQVFRIQEGIDYLHGIEGSFHIGPGPRVCSRVSCSHKSAIYFCNDNPRDIWVDADYVADYAQDIVDACQTFDDSARVRGQQFAADYFDPNNWNVIVALDFDHC